MLTLPASLKSQTSLGNFQRNKHNYIKCENSLLSLISRIVFRLSQFRNPDDVEMMLKMQAKVDFTTITKQKAIKT